MDLSVIIPSVRPTTLAHVVQYLHNQSYSGLQVEFIIIQESDPILYNTIRYPINSTIIRQPPHHDCGANARDLGITQSTGKYLIFWDDDNIYYPHALATVFSVANGFDIGVVKIRHRGIVIPINKSFKAGDIDSMCFCVARHIATKVKWTDEGGRFNDFRYITKTAGLATTINHSPIIIGEHL